MAINDINEILFRNFWVIIFVSSGLRTLKPKKPKNLKKFSKKPRFFLPCVQINIQLAYELGYYQLSTVYNLIQ